jgi:hypothetical protein
MNSFSLFGKLPIPTRLMTTSFNNLIFLSALISTFSLVSIVIITLKIPLTLMTLLFPIPVVMLILLERCVIQRLQPQIFHGLTLDPFLLSLTHEPFPSRS